LSYSAYRWLESVGSCNAKIAALPIFSGLEHEETFNTMKNRTDLIEMYRSLENRRLLDIKIMSGSARSLLTVSFQCP
jgi:hypothetical protein